jgi:hypothetical protein
MKHIEVLKMIKDRADMSIECQEALTHAIQVLKRLEDREGWKKEFKKFFGDKIADMSNGEDKPSLITALQDYLRGEK